MKKNQNTKHRSRINSGMRVLATGIVLILLNAACTKFLPQHIAYESMSIVILDQSRVENMKTRHILHEFLLKKIIDKGTPWLAVFDSDTIKNHPRMAPDYCVIFDIMEYAADIGRGESKILASVKIVKQDSNIIMASFIACKKDGSIEKVCEALADNLAAAVVKKLSFLRRIHLEMPAATSEPQDSLEKSSAVPNP